jgi:hypothetical protein
MWRPASSRCAAAAASAPARSFRGSEPALKGPWVFVLALALAGCGGDDANTSTFVEPPPLTKSEFLAEADRICFAAESQIEAAADDYAGEEKPDPAEVRRLVTRVVVPKLRGEVTTIRLLDPPPEDEAQIEEILAATEQGADELEADPESVLDDIPDELREAERLARAYGSKECGLR